MSQGLERAFDWLGTVATLGRMWLYSRRPHIEDNLPDDLGTGPWVALATQHAVQPGEPVYGTPCYQPVEPGGRFWIFCEPGEYFVYAVRGDDVQIALRDFYKSPDDARLIAGAVISEPGFRTTLKPE